MTQDDNSKLIRKCRRELVKRGLVGSHAAADKYIRIHGVDKSLSDVGLQKEKDND